MQRTVLRAAADAERCDWFTAFGGIRTTPQLDGYPWKLFGSCQPHLESTKAFQAIQLNDLSPGAERFLISAAGKGGNQKIRT